MMKAAALLLLLAMLAGTTGCAICCTPFDEAYAAYGGKWQRGDMYHGRVGSAFAPAGATVTETVPAGTPVAPIIEPAN